MRLPVSNARLIEKRSDETDRTDLVNDIRRLLVQRAEEYREISTTDATVTEIWSDTLPANSVADILFTAVGATATASSAAGYRRRAVFKRVGTAAVAIIGTEDVIGTDKEDVAGWDAAFALDAARPGMVFATVTGAAATVIGWRAHVEALVVPWS